MKAGYEYKLTEHPAILYLKSLGYAVLEEEKNDAARDGQNQVILRDEFLNAIRRINNITEDEAASVYNECLNLEDNEKWLYRMRGDYSKKLDSEKKKQTIFLVDFVNPRNNLFTVTGQFTVEAEKTHRPDIVCFINGIPVVVIEAKSPVSFKEKMGDAFDQVKLYEKNIPRLFYSNLFNIITDGKKLLYGATGSPSDFWAEWKEPYPKTDNDFTDEFEKGLYCLLEPSRLLDILAHFIIFERDENKNLVKKICRYQQYRAVNKIVNRIMEKREAAERRGLIWHTQGSGKSLTMVFAVLKIKQHLTLHDAKAANYNILVITDRVDLDDQISKTFRDCGLPNPVQIDSSTMLDEQIHRNTTGLTLLCTIFKFSSLIRPVQNSGSWIICCDESHRTQEKDLAAYLRKAFTEAWFFGFTGTPVQNNDHDTYANFSPKNELYLDKYGIDDAVADGATVPIYYTARKAEWHLEAEKLDILFDNWFCGETEEKRNLIKKKGLTIETLAKHQKRIELIAYDIWTYFKEYALKDGYKAQVVAVDREAIILYKRELNRIITKDFQKQGLSLQEAGKKADEYSVCVYSPNQTDANPNEDPYMDSIRKDLVKYQLSDDKTGKWAGIKKDKANRTEKSVTNAFKIKGAPPYFLIVCAKLLTGFDCKIESVMYLDHPLKEHALLQAIARTNRVESANKENGLIVDYIGVTKHLNEALSAYRKEDIKNAMRDIDELRSRLKAAHRELMESVTIIRTGNDRQEYQALIKALGTLDNWLLFKQKAQAFTRAYDTLSPDPEILKYTKDLKWIIGFMALASVAFEKKENVSLKDYSKKIRDMLEEHLAVTGIKTIVQLKDLNDPLFFNDFDDPGDDLQTTAVRKAAELKKIISEKVLENPHQYESFSRLVMELIKRFEQGLLSASEMLTQEEELARSIVAEEHAYKKSGLTKKAHGVYEILKAFTVQDGEKAQPEEVKAQTPEYKAGFNKLQKLAIEIDGLYSSNDTAPPGWHLKEMLKKELRQAIRRIIIAAGFTDWKNIPVEIETYALKHYIRIP